MWNSTALSPPPINSFRGKSITIDLNAVTHILVNGMKSLNKNVYNSLRTESILLSQCVYRIKLQFRNDKGFKIMEKTNTLLKKFLRYDLVSDLKYFYNSMPKKYEKDLYLPTQQMLEYLLVRMQGYAQLLKRIGESAVNTAVLMNNRLGLGHLWSAAAIALGLVSRIWQITKYLIKKCCLIYNDLIQLRDKLEPVGLKWLEDDYEFPLNLTDWLDANWLYKKADVISNFQLDLPVFNLLDESDDEDVQYCYQYKLNDCVVIEDESLKENDDVQLIEPDNNKKMDFIIDDSDSSIIEIKPKHKTGNTEQNKEIDLIIDDSDSNSVEINAVNKISKRKIGFDENISNSNKTDTTLNITDQKNKFNLNNTTDVIDIISMIEDDDVGEIVPRNQNQKNVNIRSKKKKKNKSKIVQLKTNTSIKKKKKKKTKVL